MGVSSSGIDKALKCLGLPIAADLLIAHPEVSDSLASWGFYWSLNKLTALKDNSVTEMSDGHVTTKFSAKHREDLSDTIRSAMNESLYSLRKEAGITVEPKLMGIAVGKSTKRHYSDHVCVENAL